MEVDRVWQPTERARLTRPVERSTFREPWVLLSRAAIVDPSASRRIPRSDDVYTPVDRRICGEL
jgi:hypothetical protein